jgi:hypothetical protein
MSDETFAVRINGGKIQHIIVASGIYEIAALAAPALLMDEIDGREPIMIEIWAPRFVGTHHHQSFHFLLSWDRCGQVRLQQASNRRQRDGAWRPITIPIPGGVPAAEWHEPNGAKHGPEASG